MLELGFEDQSDLAQTTASEQLLVELTAVLEIEVMSHWNAWNLWNMPYVQGTFDHYDSGATYI